MNVFVSVGEAVDKLSILELKYKKIADENKRVEIKKEIDCLNQCEKYKNDYSFFYKLLLYINEKIWVMTDKIKTMVPDVDTLDFAKLSSLIFDYNQKRFRIKNWFNLLVNSELKEQKSYGSTYCNIKFTNEEDVLNKIPEINYLLLEYDIIFIEKSNYELFTNIFTPLNNSIRTADEFSTKLPVTDLNIAPLWCADSKLHRYKQPSIFPEREQEHVEQIILSDFTIPSHNPILQELFPHENVRDVFEFETIKYIAGGRLGDFIHQLSVINEKFYKTGRRGDLYISNRGDSFRFSLEDTHNDTFGIIQKQRYIKNYKIYNGEPFDIDLTEWRKKFKNDSDVGYTQGWHISFKEIYDVEWGKHRWINTPINEIWKDKVLINTVSYRFCDFIDFNKLLREHNNKVIFVFNNKGGMSDYVHFVQKTNIRLPYYVIGSFEEMCILINSCKLFVGSRSAPLTIAHATHVPHIIGTDLSEPTPMVETELVNIWDFVKINYA